MLATYAWAEGALSAQALNHAEQSVSGNPATACVQLWTWRVVFGTTEQALHRSCKAVAIFAAYQTGTGPTYNNSQKTDCSNCACGKHVQM